MGLKITWGIGQVLLMLANDVETNPGPVDIKKLYAAVVRGDLTKVQEVCDTIDKSEVKSLLVTKAPEIGSGYTVLHVAAATSVQVLRYLINLVPDMNLEYVNEYGDTPLHTAAVNGKAECTQFLVESGANVNSRNDDGQTAMDLAMDLAVASYLSDLNKFEEHLDISKTGSKPSDEGESIIGYKQSCTDETTVDESHKIGKTTIESQETIKDFRKGPPEEEVELDTSNMERGVSFKKRQYSVDLNLPENYLIDNMIGCGGFGRVYLCIDQDTGRSYAVKNCCYKSIDGFGITKELKSFKREISILKELKHPNIVAYHGQCDEGGQLNIFMEYVGGGSVRAYIAKYGPLTIKLTVKWLRDMLIGLSYLHQQKIIHRDLKSANLLRTHEGTIKLADFGASKCLNALQSMAQTYIGTPYWMSPEVIDRDDEDAGYTEKVDIWGVGVIAFEFLIGRAPFEHLRPLSAQKKIFNNQTKTICEEKLVLPIADDKSRNFILRCVQFNPEGRPSAEEALKDPAFFSVGQ